MPKRKFALLKRREEFQSHFTVLDIGTEFVKALIVKRENDKGIVLGVGKVRQAQTHMQAGAVADLQAVIDNCDRGSDRSRGHVRDHPGSGGHRHRRRAGPRLQHHHDHAEAAAPGADHPGGPRHRAAGSAAASAA